jgi:hypothetical protein
LPALFGDAVLLIREAQMAALGEAAAERFALVAAKHLKQVLPEECAEMGDTAVRDSIDLAIRKAESYGIHEQLDILVYLNLMYVLGFDFDTDPELPWAGELLRDKELDPGSKVELLWDRVVESAVDAEEDSVG